MAQEVFFSEHEFIVSRTDIRGKIVYANDTFLQVAGYTEDELLGRPHSIIRHVDMPRCVFKLLWDTIQQGKEILAYVKNECKNGDYYWVLAYVTADLDPRTSVINGYFSVRRVPNRSAVDQIESLYAQLREVESQHASKVKGIEASTKVLTDLLTARGVTYAELVYALQSGAVL